MRQSEEREEKERRVVFATMRDEITRDLGLDVVHVTNTRRHIVHKEISPNFSVVYFTLRL